VAALCSRFAANRRAADAPELRPRLVWAARRDAPGVDAYPAAASKRDQREYAERPVPEDSVSRILDAGRIAGGEEPSALAVPRARGAPVGRPGCADRLRTFQPARRSAGRIVVSGKGPVAFDAGRAAQNTMLAAWNEGVSCPNGIANPDSLGRAGTRLVVEEDRSRPARGPLEPRRGRGLPAPPRRGLGAVPGQPLPGRALSGGRRAPARRHDRPRDRDRSLRPFRSGRARAGRPCAWPRHPRLLLLPRPASRRRRRRGGCHPGVSAGRGRSGALPRAGPA
jgi:hypothetical protein